METFPNLQVYVLSEKAFIAGTYTKIRYNGYSIQTGTSGSSPIDFSGVTVEWKLYPFDQPDYVALSKTATGYNGYFTVELLSTDTIDLRGRYIQRAYIDSGYYYDYYLGLGFIDIIPANGEG